MNSGMSYLSSNVWHVLGAQYMNYVELPIDWKHFYLVKLGKQDGTVLLEFRSAHFGRESGVDWITKSPKSWN